MKLTRKQKTDKLRQLADDFGFDDELDLFESCIFDSLAPAICTTAGCDYTTEYEPDCEAGYCESCGQRTVVSCLVLGELI